MWTFQDNLQRLTDISTDVLLLCSPLGLITYANKRSKYLLDGLSDYEANLQHLFGLDNHRLIKQKLEEVSQNLKPQVFLLKHLKRDYNFFIYPGDGENIVCIEDVTERRELGNLLKETTSRLNFAEKISHIGYWELDFKARKIFWSSEMFRIFDVDAKQISMKRNIIKEQIIKEDLPIYKNKLRELLKLRRPVEGKLRLRHKNGRITYCFFKADMINYNHDSKIAGTFQDLSELVKTEKALEKARNLAEQSNRAKSYFLAQASHDLRQPLQALNIFTGLLSEEKLDARQQNLVDKINLSANALKNLFDNLLDISKLEAGGISIDKNWFNIGQLLHNITHEYIDQAAEKGIKLHLTECNQEIYSDSLLIERIIRNYLSNALKYAKSKILIGSRRQGGNLKIIVADDGPGIKTDEQKLIFDEFYQSSNILNNKKNGSGLGLTIVKKISEFMDAEIGVDSIFGQGSSFWLKLDISGPGYEKSPL